MRALAVSIAVSIANSVETSLTSPIPGELVSIVTADRELSSTRTVAHRERGWPARNSEPTGNTVNSNTRQLGDVLR